MPARPLFLESCMLFSCSCSLPSSFSKGVAWDSAEQRDHCCDVRSRRVRSKYMNAAALPAHTAYTTIQQPHTYRYRMCRPMLRDLVQQFTWIISQICLIRFALFKAKAVEYFQWLVGFFLISVSTAELFRPGRLVRLSSGIVNHTSQKKTIYI